MRKKEFATREAVSILAANGFSFLRPGKGGHSIYSNGKANISIPVHGKTINKMMFARIIKENGLKV